jgi:inhibitor of cysteine peptidase
MDGQRPDHQEQVEHRQSVLLLVGEVVAVTVDDLPGAGYRWVVRDVPEGLTVVADEVAAPLASADVGGPARRTLTVRGDRAGSYDLRLALVRPWEPADTPPAETRRVTVRVDPPAP